MAVRINRGDAEDGGFIIGGKIHATRRELQVLALLADGLENEDAAERLKVSVQTLRNHQYNVMKKLGANTRAHAVTIAIQRGMLATDREQAFGNKPKGKYMWCLHCERTYEYGQFRVIRQRPFTVDHIRYEPEYEMCPYEDCDGDAVMDAWDWRDVREEHPEYPEIPEVGKRYALYQ
ncbi:MAG: response regulator transcription factor [Candidatus Thorarchaeota archaeon]|jgi:DNA-binding CsgD family transcriptional regulator